MAKVRHITKELALQTLQEIAAERPDYMYERVHLGHKFEPEYGSCANWDTKGNPSCIVGHAAFRWGFTAEDLQGVGIGPCDAAYELLSNLSNLGIEVDEDAWEPVAIAQEAQDDGATWGEAVVLAELGNEAVNDLACDW